MKDKKIALKILDAISKVVGKKKIALHEPVFWSNEKKQLSNV